MRNKYYGVSNLYYISWLLKVKENSSLVIIILV